MATVCADRGSELRPLNGVPTLFINGEPQGPMSFQWGLEERRGISAQQFFQENMYQLIMKFRGFHPLAPLSSPNSRTWPGPPGPGAGTT